VSITAYSLPLPLISHRFHPTIRNVYYDLKTCAPLINQLFFCDIWQPSRRVQYITIASGNLLPSLMPPDLICLCFISFFITKGLISWDGPIKEGLLPPNLMAFTKCLNISMRGEIELVLKMRMRIKKRLKKKDLHLMSCGNFVIILRSNLDPLLLSVRQIPDVSSRIANPKLQIHVSNDSFVTFASQKTWPEGMRVCGGTTVRAPNMLPFSK
jgi:hypothetical protein